MLHLKRTLGRIVPAQQSSHISVLHDCNSWCVQLSKNVLLHVKNKLNDCRKKEEKGTGGTDRGSAVDMACASWMHQSHACPREPHQAACLHKVFLVAS